MFNLSHAVTVSMCLMFLVDTLYGMTGSSVLPGGDGFALLVLVIAAYLGGFLVNYFLKLPPLVGMLAVGILFRNIPLPFSTYIPQNASSSLRSVALVVILLETGLGLDPNQLRTLKWTIVRMSFLPCILEVVATVLLSRLLLGMPWLWAFMLGFILTAVSVAVLVPGALKLQRRQIGTRKGIPTLLMAAVSMDNVAALTGFFVLFNIVKNNGSATGWTLMVYFLEPFLGSILGTILGFLLWYFPAKRPNAYVVTYYQTLLLCLGGLSFVFLSKRFGTTGIGAMGCISLAFVASLEWRKDVEQFGRIKWITGKLRQLIEPFMFSLMGAQITTEHLKNNLVNNVLVLAGGASTRLLAVILALTKSPLDLREKTFVALSWISKATVQAAVGSDAIEYSKDENKGDEFDDLGKKVLTLSVLVIIVTAPLGAILMDLLGRSLLESNKVLIKITTENSILPTTDSADTDTKYGACNRGISPA